MKAEVVLADEEEVRKAAESAGFKARGCLGILIEAVKNKIISSPQAVQDVNNLASYGYRVSHDEMILLRLDFRRLDSGS